MDRKYLEEYKQKELDIYNRLLVKRIENGQFDGTKDKYPPRERFFNLQKPVAMTSLESAQINNVWAQIPFCGSLILPLAPWPLEVYESSFFKIKEAQKLIDFVKETGKIQFVLINDPLFYECKSHLDTFFEQLNPPWYVVAPLSCWANRVEVKKAYESFTSIGKIKYFDWLKRLNIYQSHLFEEVLVDDYHTYVTLKTCHFPIAEDIENLMIDNPEEADSLLTECRMFITNPIGDFLCDVQSFTLSDIIDAKILPKPYQPKIELPCEIGKFLLNKLTYAPMGFDACKDIMYHYDSYDLKKVQESLNEAIVVGKPDLINENVRDFSEILDSIWNDKTIVNRIKNLQVGIPLSMAAIGSVAAGPIGKLGLLAGLGYAVADKFMDFGTEKISEKIAKFKTRNYQANIYDFKKMHNLK